jgi:hypothetical protein
MHRQVAGEDLLIPVRGSVADMQRLFVLDGIADFIWQRLDGKRSAADLVREVVADFDVAHDVAEADVQRFLSELDEQGLICRVAGT